MSDEKDPARYVDQIVDIVQSPAMKMAFYEVAKEACEHVLLRLGIRASDPAEIVNIQADVHHLRVARLQAALTSQRQIEFEVWMKNHDRRCLDLEEERKGALARIEVKIAEAENKRKGIRRRMDVFITALIGGMGTAIWYLMTHEVVFVIHQ